MPPYIKTIFLAAQNNSDCYYYNNKDQSGRLYYTGGDQVNGPIYDQGSYLSFGFPLSSPLTVYITVELPDGDSTENIALQFAEGSLSNNVTCSISWSGQGDGCQAFTAVFQPEKFGTPWSIVQSISWTITVNGGAPIPLSSSTFIEGYGILMDQPSYLQTEGIPIQLLRLFNRPSINGVLQTEQDWISWVTHVVHGTQDPNGTPLQFRPDSTQHWLRYNVWTGADSFVGENGGSFDLEGWLDTYSSPVTKLVNCFDQAAIVLVTLGLGLDWNRLKWEILAPFGYISADLTGWGQTNSPFFEADDQNKTFTDLADPMRTPFRSHVFVGISPTVPYDQPNAVIADACAGPVYGNKTYPVYKSENATHDGLEVLTRGHSAPAQPWGITSTVVKKSAPNGLDKWIVWWDEGKTQSLDSVVEQLRTAFTDSPTVSSAFDAETIINEVLQPILDKQDPSFILGEQSPLKTTVNGTDASVLTNGTTTRRTIAGYVTNKGAPAYILFQITSFPGLEDALSGLQQRLGRFTWPSTWKVDNLINIQPAATDPDDAIADQRAVILGGSHVSIFLYKNTIVELGGNSLGTQDMMPAWVKDFWTALSEY